MQSRAACSAVSSSLSVGAAPRHHNKASFTDSARASDSQPLTMPSRRLSRLSCSGVGLGQAVSASRVVDSRNSILPRLKAAPSISRSAGSIERSSSGSLKARSRKRPLTERSSMLTAERSVLPSTAARALA